MQPVMSALDHWLSLSSVVWLFPVAFMFHDLEEIVFVEPFLRRNRDRIRALLPRRLVPFFEARARMRADQFAVAVAVVLALVLAVALVSSRRIERGELSPLFAGAVSFFLAHALVHTAQSLLLRAYTPGVVTSWAVVIPYSAYALYRLDAAGLYEPAMLLAAVPVAAFTLVVVPAAHRVGMLVRPAEPTSPHESH